MIKVKPIILLGAARNGTTMLCNLATEHTEISSVQHRLHWGFHESNIYENVKFWGNFDTLDKYLHFLELYCSMDTFQITGLSKEYFYRENFPKDFLDFYFEMMDEFAIKQGSKYWLTKIDSLYLIDDKEMSIFLDRLYKRYGEIKFISIKRNINDVIPSYLKMDGKQKRLRESLVGKPFAFILSVIRQYLYYKKINELIQKYDGLKFEFEKVVIDQEKYRKIIFDFLGLAIKSETNIKHFQQNSSFDSNESKKNSNFLNIQIRFFYFIVKYTPILPKILLRGYQKIKPKRFPDFWRLKKEKYFLNRFEKELENGREVKLLKILKR